MLERLGELMAMGQKIAMMTGGRLRFKPDRDSERSGKGCNWDWMLKASS